jgi:hypothetical protein
VPGSRASLRLSVGIPKDHAAAAPFREWLLRAGVDILDFPDPASWPRRPRAEEDPAADPIAACTLLLDELWPDPLEPSLYADLKRTAHRYPDRALYQRIPGLYQQIQEALGWDRFRGAAESDPGAVWPLLERWVTRGATLAGEAVARGAAALILVEEMGGRERSPAEWELLDRWVFTFDRMLLEGPAGGGVPIIAWCPGGREAHWRRFLALGASALGPVRLGDLSPQGMGAFYGLAETPALLAHGPPEAIRRHVEEAARAAGPEAHLILAVPEVPPRTPLGNLEGLIAAIRDTTG